LEEELGNQLLNGGGQACTTTDGGIPLPEDDMSLSSDDSNFWGGHKNLQHVVKPSTVPLPPEIQDAMFVPPKGFDSDTLYGKMGTEDGLNFGHKAWECMTPLQKSYIDLLCILKGKPLELVDQVMDWRWRSQLQYRHTIKEETSPPKRKTFMEELMKMYGYDNLKPTVINVHLPNTGVEVGLVRFPFGEMLASLLSNPVAMQPKNLAINPGNPFKKPVYGGSEGEVGEFCTGKAHCQAWECLCKDPANKKLMCELTLFINKTYIDIKGKHTVEPIACLLHWPSQPILPKKTRGLEANWSHS